MSERKAVTGYLDTSIEVVDEPFAISCPRCGSMETTWLTPPRVSGYFCAFVCECRTCAVRFEVAVSIIDTKIITAGGQ